MRILDQRSSGSHDVSGIELARSGKWTVRRKLLRFLAVLGCSLMPLLASAEIKDSYSTVNIGSNTTLTLPLSIENTYEISPSGQSMTENTTLKGVIANISVPSGMSASLQVECGDFMISSGSLRLLKYVALVNGVDKHTISEREMYRWNLSSDSTAKLYITASGLKGSATGTCKMTVTYSGSGTTGKVMVSFNANGGSVSPSQKEYTVGATYGSLPTPTRSGYRFVRWVTSTGSGVTTSSLASASVTTLTAQWEKIESDPDPQTVSVTFYLNDPSGLVNKSTSKIYTVGSTYGTFPSFTLSGYAFQGWYTSGGTRYYESSTVSASVTRLYAHWRESASAKPDLQPYMPSGWSAPLVVSTSSTSTMDSSLFSSDDTIYVSWSAICRGGSAGAFKIALEVDGVRKQAWSCSGLNEGYYTHKDSYSIGRFSPGSHEIKVVIDPEGGVAESNESNNTYSKTITVRAAPLNPVSSSISLSATATSGSSSSFDVSAFKWKFDKSAIPSWVTSVVVHTGSGGSTYFNPGSGTTTFTFDGPAYFTVNTTANTGAARNWTWRIEDSSGNEVCTLTVTQSEGTSAPADFVLVGLELRAYVGTASTVVIPDGVKSIGQAAFSHCSAVKGVTIPEGVTRIGESAFFDCRWLESVTIPSSVTSIERMAFEGCSVLKKVVIPDGVKRLESSVFSECIGLTSVTLPSNLASVGDFAFDKCSGLKSVIIPDGVTYIGGYAFYGCSGLADVVIPSSVTSIKPNTFYGCSGLTSVTIPKNVTSIGDAAFYGCSGLKNITIPEGVTSIGNYTFMDCSGLTSVTIPSSVTSIGSGAFYNCEKLAVVYVAAGDSQRVSELMAGSGFDVSGVTFIEPPGVRFDANGGTGTMASLAMEPNKVYKLPKCTLAPPRGKRFAGWACSNGRRYDDEMLVFGLGSVTMTAIWQ